MTDEQIINTSVAYGGSVSEATELMDEEPRRKGLWIYVIGSGGLSVVLTNATAVANKGIIVTADTPFVLTSLHYKGPVNIIPLAGSVQYAALEGLE